MSKLKEQRGFTLVEIMIVILIVAVMAAVLIPALGGAIRKAWESKAIQDASRAREAAQVLATEEFIKNGYEDGDISIDKDAIADYLGKSNLFDNADITAESTEGASANEGGYLDVFEFIDNRHDITIQVNDDGELEVVE